MRAGAESLRAGRARNGDGACEAGDPRGGVAGARGVQTGVIPVLLTRHPPKVRPWRGAACEINGAALPISGQIQQVSYPIVTPRLQQLLRQKKADGTRGGGLPKQRPTGGLGRRAHRLGMSSTWRRQSCRQSTTSFVTAAAAGPASSWPGGVGPAAAAAASAARVMTRRKTAFSRFNRLTTGRLIVCVQRRHPRDGATAVPVTVASQSCGPPLRCGIPPRMLSSARAHQLPFFARILALEQFVGLRWQVRGRARRTRGMIARCSSACGPRAGVLPRVFEPAHVMQTNGCACNRADTALCHHCQGECGHIDGANTRMKLQKEAETCKQAIRELKRVAT